MHLKFTCEIHRFLNLFKLLKQCNCNCHCSPVCTVVTLQFYFMMRPKSFNRKVESNYHKYADIHERQDAECVHCSETMKNIWKLLVRNIVLNLFKPLKNRNRNCNCGLISNEISLYTIFVVRPQSFNYSVETNNHKYDECH